MLFFLYISKEKMNEKKKYLRRIKGKRRLLIEMNLTKKREMPFISFMYKGSLLTLNNLIMMLIMTTIKHIHELIN